MDTYVVLLEFLLPWMMFRTEILATTVTTPEVLKCYDCSDTFKSKWDPYTPCQVNVTAMPVATCLDFDRYCKVELVTIKDTGATVSISRGCSGGECLYGCLLQGYGVTRLRCTSCCNETLCNTGSGAPSVFWTVPWLWTQIVICVCLSVTVMWRRV